MEEDFGFGKDRFGLDQCQALALHRYYRHAVLVMAALAVCAVTAAPRAATAPAPRHRRHLRP